MKTTLHSTLRSKSYNSVLTGKPVAHKLKHLLLLALVFAAFNQQAQSGLSNLSFENWSTTFFGPCPTGWTGLGTSQQTTGAQQGTSYVRLSNSGTGQEGLLFLGTVTTFTSVRGGAPWTHAPTQLTGFYKTSGMGAADSVSIWGYTSMTGSITSFANLVITGNTAGWTSFSIPFMTVSGGPIDSLFIYASSDKMSNSNHNSLSATLDLDNLSLSLPVVSGIAESSLGTSFLIYPNPASTELTIISKDEAAASILIIGGDGKITEEIQLTGHTKIDLQNYVAGMYSYSIRDKDGKALLGSKFIVTK